jgi:hypothetical protein
MDILIQENGKKITAFGCFVVPRIGEHVVYGNFKYQVIDVTHTIGRGIIVDVKTVHQ